MPLALDPPELADARPRRLALIFSAVRSAGRVIVDLAFGNRRRSVITTLLAWSTLADSFGGSRITPPPIALSLLAGFYYLSLAIKSDLSRRSSIRRRLSSRRDNILRRIEGADRNHPVLAE